jgi:hypothetical protein
MIDEIKICLKSLVTWDWGILLRIYNYVLCTNSSCSKLQVVMALDIIYNFTVYLGLEL